MGSHIFRISGIRQFCMVSKNRKIRSYKWVPAVVLIYNSRLTLNSILEITTLKTLTICQKVTKMGSIIGHRIDYNRVRDSEDSACYIESIPSADSTN